MTSLKDSIPLDHLLGATRDLGVHAPTQSGGEHARSLGVPFETKEVKRCPEVSLVPLVRTVVDELWSLAQAQIHINPAGADSVGSIQCMLEGHAFWTLPLPADVCHDLILSFKDLSEYHAGKSKIGSIGWSLGDGYDAVMVRAEACGKDLEKIVIWIATGTH